MSEMRKLINLLESIDKGESYKINGITVIDIDDFVDKNVDEDIDEGKYKYPQGMKGKGGADQQQNPAGKGQKSQKGAKNRKQRKAFRKKQRAEQHAARMRGEIDEAPEDEMLGAVTAPFKGQELQDYLQRIKDKEKSKSDKFGKPYIHGSNIEIIDDASGRKFDTDKLMALVMERPKVILKQNQKMQHSDGTSSVFYNVGLPALKGLAVNEKKKEFVIVNTCPGAGVCKTFCYAMKGGYVQWKAVSMGQSRMLNFLINDSAGFSAQMKAELTKAEKKASKKNDKVIVRWHDAGDFFSPQYLALGYDIARSFPNVDFYAYTKIASVAQGEKPDNFRMNYSEGALRSQEKQIDFIKTKHSKVVPLDMFSDLIAREGNKLIKDDKGRQQFASEENKQEFKQRMAKKYVIQVDSILTYDEMMATPVSDAGMVYNIIVMPGDGDDSANRPDVLGSYLLFH